MALVENFEDLRIWQDARILVKRAYSAFPPNMDDRSYRDQLQRAAVSVMNNIAEGFERRTRKDFAHFLDLAKGSAGEIRSMLYVAEDLQYLPGTEAAAFREEARALSRGIAAFTRHLRTTK